MDDGEAQRPGVGGVRVAALAWLLSLVARENRRGQRAAWIAAYIGLPLLYAAFNTFPGVHDVVLSGFSLVSGAPPARHWTPLTRW